MDFGFIFSFPSLLLLIAIALLSIYLVARLLPKPKIDIKGKYVLITGCDTGFGRATAIELDRMGAHVLATCLTNEGGKGLKSVTSDKLKTFQMDVTNSERIKDVYEEIKKETSLGEMTNKACFGKEKSPSCLDLTDDRLPSAHLRVVVPVLSVNRLS